VVSSHKRQGSLHTPLQFICLQILLTQNFEQIAVF
jgi:hypothetical protein